MYIKETTPPSSRKFNLEIDENELKILTAVFGYMSGGDIKKAVNISNYTAKSDMIEFNSYDFYITLLNALKA
jgi:hypothetical protein